MINIIPEKHLDFNSFKTIDLNKRTSLSSCKKQKDGNLTIYPANLK